MEVLKKSSRMGNSPRGATEKNKVVKKVRPVDCCQASNHGSHGVAYINSVVELQPICEAHQIIGVGLEIRVIPLRIIKQRVNVGGENHVENHHLEVQGKHGEEEMPCTLRLAEAMSQNHRLSVVSVYLCVQCVCYAAVSTQLSIANG
ncbi:hypothetical protein F3Y22_tig00112508pilonHSYRG00106 [Hibiscus syriacus]|uniref:Uncharacterized protein n=1 Tax=Hibiscus syriacus TaxID=106335 RepID=A0A6A2XG44_HIBSY|nr:hypothetical protein F3Y22_tig00112508pilonHSYRG00106 [Hibiscus syriacus]